jgi:tetratricopeptide (TPR) repeat protein
MNSYYVLRNGLLSTIALFGLFCLSFSRPPQSPRLSAILPQRAVTTPGTTVVVSGEGFSPDAVLYFDGVQARETKFVSSTNLEAVTPYLRPGPAHLQLKTGGQTVRSDVTFLTMASPPDFEIDRALALGAQGHYSDAVRILINIGKSSPDFQVRSLAYYQVAKIHFDEGDVWRAAGEAAQIFDSNSGMAVQTAWRYRLLSDETDYYLPVQKDLKDSLVLADYTVEKDVTDNPEPRFFRALLNARFGELTKAKSDSDAILALEPDNPSYKALAAYVALLAGERTSLQSLEHETISDPRALGLLGEAEFVGRNPAAAQQWWEQEVNVYPLGAIFAYWAGKKHLTNGNQGVAAALLTECTILAPRSTEAKEAKELLAGLQNSNH